MTTVGTGRHRYRSAERWAKLPRGMEFGHLCDVATDSEDRVYVFQREDPPVVIFDREGTHLSSWGSGAYEYPHGLSIVNDLIYLTDRDANVCMVCTLDGTPILTLGEPGLQSDTGCLHDNDPVPTPAGPFNHPTKVIPSPWGDLYVADGHRNARIHRFDSSGQLIRSWGTWGRTEAGQFHSPHSILVGRDGRLYVCDRENSRIQVFWADGEFSAMWTDVQRPVDIALTPDGDYAVCEGNSKIEGQSPHLSIFNQDGQLLARWDSCSAHGLCVDSRGDVYVACTHTKTVDKYVRSDRP